MPITDAHKHHEADGHDTHDPDIHKQDGEAHKLDFAAIYRTGYLLFRSESGEDASPAVASIVEAQSGSMATRMLLALERIFGPDAEATATELGWPSAAELQRFVSHGAWGRLQ